MIRIPKDAVLISGALFFLVFLAALYLLRTVFVGNTELRKQLLPEEPSPTPSVAQLDNNNLHSATPSASHQVDEDWSMYIYPNAKIISETSRELKLEVKATADIVSNWYEDVLNGRDYSVNNRMRNNTNGKIENMFSSSNDIESVRVNITGESNNPLTTVSVSR